MASAEQIKALLKSHIDGEDDRFFSVAIQVAAHEARLGQRIFQTPFSWCALGVDVRGRSHTLRINYRTSHQIRQQADRLLPSQIADVDGVTEQRGGTISAFNGPEPVVMTLGSPEEESACIAGWLRERREEGYQPQEIGVFVRSEAELDRAIKGVEDAGFSAVVLSKRPGGTTGSVAVGTMHLAKGLEFRAVVAAGCDDEVLPLQSRIESVVDEADLEEVYNTERHLLYVACTRARDRLLVTGVEPASEFIDDLHWVSARDDPNVPGRERPCRVPVATWR